MAHLLSALRATEHIRQTAIVEIGSYRGETTRCMAQATSRHVFAIDPYIGYGGANEDYRRFKSRTDDLPAVTHLKATSGFAARAWKGVPISLLFIDAVHDYVNVRHDFSVWANLVVGGGIVAFHDTDNRNLRAQGVPYSRPPASLNCGRIRLEWSCCGNRMIGEGEQHGICR